MSGLPWVRLDADIASHDKILSLIGDPSAKRWQAAFSYVCSIGWSGGHGTDGHVPNAALPFIHGTTATAGLLQKHGLWVPEPGGSYLRNFSARQELAMVTAAKKEAQRIGGLKGNCERWHGPDCRCWKEAVA